jgi:hypothetical protein
MTFKQLRNHFNPLKPEEEEEEEEEEEGMVEGEG